MKREEHYCDRCRAPMTREDCEGDLNHFGITVLAKKDTESHTISAGMIVDTKVETNYGSTSSRFSLHGSEFCSPKCFKEAMTYLIDEVSSAVHRNVKEKL